MLAPFEQHNRTRTSNTSAHPQCTWTGDLLLYLSTHIFFVECFVRRYAKNNATNTRYPKAQCHRSTRISPGKSAPITKPLSPRPESPIRGEGSKPLLRYPGGEGSRVRVKRESLQRRTKASCATPFLRSSRKSAADPGTSASTVMGHQPSATGRLGHALVHIGAESCAATNCWSSAISDRRQKKGRH